MTQPSRGIGMGEDATVRTADLPSSSVVGEYRIAGKLGAGAMGAVYAATHVSLGKRVAIKVISADLSRDADALARFHREARVLAQLDSPNIVDVFGFGSLPDGRAYFVMEYLTGESLSARLARGRVPLDEVLGIIDQIARGLESAHAAGVVHRDLKPDNIFIERRDGASIVKLVDFGVVKISKEDDGITKTSAGVLIGTPLYAAPEQLSNASEVDGRADIYALGGVAYELVLGRVPFPYATIVEIVAAHLTTVPPQPRSLWLAIPPALDSLLLAMLAKDPAKRPTLGHVQDVTEKLRRAAFAPMQSAPPLDKPTLRQRYWLAAVGIAIGLGVIVIVSVGHGNDETVASASTQNHVDAPNDIALHVSPIATPIVITTRDAEPPASQATSHSVTRPPVAPTGQLELSTKPPCNVSIDGKPTGRRTPIVALPISAGSHRVTFENPELGISRTVDVQVAQGQVARVVENYMAATPRVDPNGTIDPFGSKGSAR